MGGRQETGYPSGSSAGIFSNLVVQGVYMVPCPLLRSWGCTAGSVY